MSQSPPAENAGAPLVSVVTPAFNAEATLAETIESVRAQTFGEWEMIVADDGSRDGTAALVERLAETEPRLRLVRLAGNAGPAGARNAALAQARGRYLAFLDSDDLWLPGKLERQIAHMRATGCGLCYTAYRRFAETPERPGPLISVPSRIDYEGLLRHTAIATLTAVVDREQAGEVRMTEAGYDDYLLWLALTRRGIEARGLNEDLARYRVVGGSVSSRPLRSARWTWEIYRRHQGLGRLRSLELMARYLLRALWKRRGG